MPQHNKERKSLYQQTGLIVGKTYTRQKLRMALGKILSPDKILIGFNRLLQREYISPANKNGLSENLDTFTLKKDFLK